MDLELVVRPKNLPTPETPPSEYGDQPDDPDAGVYEREPEPGEGLGEGETNEREKE